MSDEIHSSTKQINVNVVIADRPYPLKVTPEEEEHVRKAAKLINQKVLEMKKAYGGKDKQDFLAMAALLLVTDFLHLKSSLKYEDISLNQNLEELDNILTEFLEKTNSSSES